MWRRIRRKWWSNGEREAGHGWLSAGRAADFGRREILCWSVFLQLGFFSQLRRWGLGDSFKPRENFHWPQWTGVLGIAPGLEGIAGECVWQPSLKARALVRGKLGRQVGCLVSLSHGIECTQDSAPLLGALVPWVWRFIEERMTVPVGRETPWFWIWFGFDLGSRLLWSVKVDAVIGQFKVPGEFKINALIRDIVWFSQLTTKLAQSLFCIREIPFCHRSSWILPSSPHAGFVGQFNPTFSSIYSVTNIHTYLCVNTHI